MFRVPLSSLRVRLVLLVLIAALPAFALILWTSFEERQNERDHAEASATSLAQVVAGQQGQLVEGTRQLLGVLAALSPQSINSGTNQQVDTESCGRPLSAILAQDKRYANIGIAINGQTVCSGVPISAPVDATDRPWYKQATQTKQFAMGAYQVGTITKKQSVNFAYPVLNADNQIIVIFFAAVDLDWLNGEVAKTKLSKDTTLTLIDRHGVVLAQVPDPAAWVGKSISDRPIGHAVLSQGEGSGEFNGLDGKQRLFAYAPFGGVGRSDAYVAVGVSTASAYAGINHMLYRNLSLLGVATLLALAAAWFGGDWFILRGVRALVGAARRVEDGDLHARTGLAHDRGEIGQLAGSFDEMAEALQRREAERHGAQEALRQSEERLRMLAEHLFDGLIMAGSDGRIVMANRAAARMFGYEPDELVGQPVELLLPEELGAKHRQYRQAYATEASPRVMGAGRELRGRHKSGREFPVDVGLTPLETDEGLLVAATVRDITERKRAEDALAAQARELAVQAQELARSNADLEQFAYVASHDLQEPLRMVANYTQLLGRRYKGKLDPDADEFIDYAVDGATRMQRLIEDLLSFSRVGTRTKEVEPVACRTVVERALANLVTAIGETGAVITHDELPVVMGDNGQLGHVFQNLIANAIRFRGAEPPRIHVSAVSAGNEWTLSVQDNGIGIDSQYTDRIFVIFQRLHTRAEYPGTGIGLAICKKIVERHGGRIWVESDGEHGSMFRFTLRAAADVSAVEQEERISELVATG